MSSVLTALEGLTLTIDALEQIVADDGLLL